MMLRDQNRNRLRVVLGCVVGAAFLLFGLQTAWPQTVILQLRNGDRLTGTILSEEAGQVTLKTTWWNVVVVPSAEIKSREKVEPAAEAKAPAPPPTPVAVLSRPITPAHPKHWAGEA